MQSRCPVLVFAQSGRFIAESATRAGYPVRVADCFGDSDTLSVAEAWLQIPSFSTLSDNDFLQSVEQLSLGEDCLLICGTGIERFYPALKRLPPHIRLVGNTPETLARVRQPTQFFALLERLNLPYPATGFVGPIPAQSLVKPSDAAGGRGIKRAGSGTLQTGEFYQQFVDGVSRSACFIADGRQAKILGWNRQHHRQNSFELEMIQQPDQPSSQLQDDLETAVSALVAQTGLKGFNSLDFIVDRADRLFILEINPRISASVELLQQQNWFEWHLAACNGEWPQIGSETAEPRFRQLQYLFAEQDLQIMAEPVWPEACHDLPVGGSLISESMPICTLIVEAESHSACHKQLKQLQQDVYKNCVPRA